MTDEAHPEAAGSPALDDAVAAVEASYDALEEALDAGDVEVVADLVEARGEVIDRLAAACGGEALSEPIRARLAAREKAAQAAMEALDSRVRERLHDGSQRARAARRYARD